MHHTAKKNQYISNKFIWILFTLVLFVVMNSTVFNVALPIIGKEFNVSAATVTWVVIGYTMITAIGAVVYGKLSDIYSVRWLFIIGILLFIVGSVLGFLSDNFILLIISRFIQSFGGSSFISLSLVSVAKYFNPNSKGKLIGIVNAGIVLGSGIGPVIGGIFTQLMHWSYIFIFMTITIITIPFIAKVLPKETKKEKTFDKGGAVLTGLTVMAFLLSINTNFIFILIALPLLYLLIRSLEKKKQPFINLSYIKDSSFRGVLIIGFTSYSVLVATFVLLPFFLSSKYTMSPIQNGMFLLIGALGGSILSYIVGKVVTSARIRLYLLVGSLLMISGYILLGFWDSSAGISVVEYLIIYAGFSFIQVTSTYFLTSYFPKESAGEALGIFNLFSFLGMSFGPAIFSKLYTIVNHFNFLFYILAFALIMNIFVLLKLFSPLKND